MYKIFKKSLAKILIVAMVLGMGGITSVQAKAESPKEAKAETMATTNVTTNANEKSIQIISINDFHGSLAEEAYEGGKNLGMSKLVAAVKKYKELNPNTIVVSAGDNYQGSAMSNLTYGAPVSAMFKEMNVEVSAVGNHEFDWGIERIKEWEKDGDFKFLAANIVEKKSGEPVSWADPYYITEVSGVKIAFVGITTKNTAYMAAKDKIKDYEFLDEKETVEKWAKKLKEEKKADVVIALSHVGCGQDFETKEVSGEAVKNGLAMAEGVDAVIGGHSHEAVEGFVGDMPIVQAYKYGRAIATLTLSLATDGSVEKITPDCELVYNNRSEIIEDPTAKKKYDAYNKELAPILGEVVGKTAMTLSHDRSAEGTSVLGYFVSDIIRKEVDAQIGMMNSGGIRCAIEKGNITVGKLYEVLPFDNTVVKIKLTGEQLKRVVNNGIKNESIGWIEIAGLKVEYDLSKDFGKRVGTMYLEDGTKVEMDKYYTVATNDFMAGNGDMYDFSDVKSMTDTCVPIRDVVTEYLKESGTIKYSFEQPLVAGKAKTEDKADKTDKTDKKDKSEKTNSKSTIIVYTVVKGDSLWEIAQKYDTTFDKIAKDNNIKNPSMIYINQVLKIKK